MTIEEILSGESKNVEYKQSRPDKAIKYMKTVVAFANTGGGYLVFGVADQTRAVVGISKDLVFQEMDAITNAISDSCEPVIVPDVYLRTVDGKTIIIAEISPGKQRPYYIKSEGLDKGTYIRVSGTSRLADRNSIRELYYESEGRSYDSVMRADLSISEEEIDRLCKDMKAVALANCKNDVQRQEVRTVTKNVLLNWGILAEADDGSICPTNAYVFLVGADDFLSHIQCGMFKGNTRAVFLDKRDYAGALWKQVEDAFQFVLRNIRLGAKVEGVYRKDVYELPPESIRELIINAVMNCSFLQPSHIQVAIYDDRLEITSPGGLLPGVTIERMKEGYSQIRNRALAHAFSYMNLIEGWGTGIPKLVQEMRNYGLKEPEFLDMEVAFRVNLYRTKSNEANISAGKEPESAGEMPESAGKEPESAGEMPESAGKEPKSAGLTDQEQQIISYLMENGQITSEETSKLLVIKQRRARAVLSNMVKKGCLAKTGASRGTRYILPEMGRGGVL